MQALTVKTASNPQSFWPPAPHPAAHPIEAVLGERPTTEVERIGKYEVLGVIGAGGFSTVYKGYDPFIKRLVAIKVGHSNEPKVRAHFHREAETTGPLIHGNIPTIYDCGLHDQKPYLVQEYLTGETLADLISQREPETLEEKLYLLTQIAGGLAYAHARGIIHRDVKPANLQVLTNGRVKIMDFGTAKHTESDSRWTQSGVILGTIAYLAPECLSSQPAQIASDVFSFGLVAYELLSFRRPFEGKTIPVLIDQVLYRDPVPLSESWPACPGELAEIVHRCLAKDPGARFKSCAQVGTELERLAAR